MSIDLKTCQFYTGESRSIAFDFSEFPEVVEGETLSTPTVPAVTGLTLGTPEVLSAEFDPGDGDPPIESGKGVKVTVTSSTAGTYSVTCQVLTSGGATLKVRGRLVFNG